MPLIADTDYYGIVPLWDMNKATGATGKFTSILQWLATLDLS